MLNSAAQRSRAALDSGRQRWTETLKRMIALQEELDWECYRLYGLTEDKPRPPARASARASSSANAPLKS